MNEVNLQIVACRRCPRLVAYRQQMARTKRRAYFGQTYWGRPVPAWGDPAARLLLVGLAPGAHGSNRTGRMFTGDGSADFLTPALCRAGFANQPTSEHAADGLRLTDLYVAAVAHCAPPDNRPTPDELARCRPFLQRQLRGLPNLQVVVALGAIAFDGVLRALQSERIPLPSPRPRFAHGREVRLARLVVLGSYHPSRQNTQTGRLTAAMFDAIFERVHSILS